MAFTDFLDCINPWGHGEGAEWSPSQLQAGWRSTPGGVVSFHT